MRPTEMAAVRRVSVAIVTRDRATSIQNSIERLQDLPERPRIVVVDNGSRDDTVERVRRRLPGVDLIPLRHNVAAAGRTIGARISPSFRRRG